MRQTVLVAMWLAHALTLSRIPLAVVFWVTYGCDRWWSLALVVVAVLTDAADGRVARWSRRRTGDQRVSPGEWLDPIADKVFVILVLGAIQVHDPVPWGIIALIVARELVLIPLATLYRFLVHGQHAFKARAIGKAATIAEFVALIVLILRAPALLPVAIVTAALGLGAVIDQIVRVRHEADQDPQPRTI